MRIGLVSIQSSLADRGDTGGLPAGAATRLALWQTGFCHAAGCSSVILIVSKIDPNVLRLQSEAEALGLTASVAVGPAQLQQQVLGSDELLLLAEGRYFDRDFADQVKDMRSNELLVVENASPNDGFERIDSTHHWAGAALLAPELVSQLQDLPEDWAWDSALLRRATQAGARRRLVSTEDLLEKRVVDVHDLVTFGEIEDARRELKAGTFQRGPAEASIRAIVDDLVEGRRLGEHLAVYRFPLALGFSLISIATGYLGWTVASFVIFLLTSIIWLGREKDDRLDERSDFMSELGEAVPILLLGILVTFGAVHQNMATLAVAGFVGLNFSGLVWLVQPYCGKGSLFALVGDHVVLGGLFILISAIGATAYLAMLISTICLIKLILTTKNNEKTSWRS